MKWFKRADDWSTEITLSEASDLLILFIVMGGVVLLSMALEYGYRTWAERRAYKHWQRVTGFYRGGKAETGHVSKVERYRNPRPWDFEKDD